MEKEEILLDLSAMESDELIHELHESRRRAIDFMNYQQQMYIELQNKAVEVKTAETEAIPEPKAEAIPEPVEEPEVDTQTEDVQELLISYLRMVQKHLCRLMKVLWKQLP